MFEKRSLVPKTSPKLSARTFAFSLAIWSALFMLVLWIAAQNGIYVSAAAAMQEWHVFFDMSVAGLIGGMIEAAVVSFVGVYTFVWVYNFTRSKLL